MADQTSLPLTNWDVAGPCPLTPEVELAYDRQHEPIPNSFPDRCIICYQPPCRELAAERFGAQCIDKVGGDLYEFRYKGKRLGVVQAGIGARMAVLAAERLIARGIRYLLNVGMAGFLQPHGATPGQLVACTKAVRCEGCSYLYLPPSRYIDADPEMTCAVTAAAEQLGVSCLSGPTITIDAPGNFPYSKLREMRDEGVLTCEMEAAAILAVARVRNVRAAALFVVSDLWAEDFSWQPKFHAVELARGFDDLFRVSVEALAALP